MSCYYDLRIRIHIHLRKIFINNVTNIRFPWIGGMSTLKNDNEIRRYNHKLFKSMRANEGIDDATFNVWKTGLQRELPSFWESFTR